MRINSLEELACAALGDRFQANRIATTDGFWPRTTGQWIGAVRPAQVIRSSRKRRFICADGQSQLSVGTVAQTTMQGLVAPFVGLDLLPFCPSVRRTAEPRPPRRRRWSSSPRPPPPAKRPCDMCGLVLTMSARAKQGQEGRRTPTFWRIALCRPAFQTKRDPASRNHKQDGSKCCRSHFADV